MTDKKPFDKEQSIRIPFSELVELINQNCDGKYVIAGGCHAEASPLRLDSPLFFYPFPRPTGRKITTFP